MPTPFPLLIGELVMENSLASLLAASAAEVECVANLDAAASLGGCDKALERDAEAEGTVRDVE